ncbi:ABC transporter ATP-binding protein [Brachybacterium halotolerans subsp. kimchii]|uniref:dipeptide ABC transporter ATP-binding protein n=1 Tax=Brachybacterium halotolerans TaxID=2795215 RepID=UPI001E48D222|nr:ABC transporter ATP-binding protein [Brachybacterium halotolerans]UEJ81299.1 ABC transporter ATP-binding protein [Brachybacterium halotolerans subsp. kimchii]
MNALITAQNLSVSFDDVEVVHDVSLALRPGSCLGIVGESGSGKSVTARSLLGLNGERAAVRADRLEAAGTDLLRASDAQLRSLRGRRIGYVLQDALVSLDPLRRVGAEIAEPLRVHGVPRRAREGRVHELLAAAGVPEPELRARQLPSELSGGLRQRALIAAALALDPEVLIADEPTTALDVTVQAQILSLLEANLAAGRAIILISHDLAVVERLADEVLVMKDGRVVEQGPTSQVLSRPADPYTRRLLAAVPSARSRGSRLSDAPPLELSARDRERLGARRAGARPAADGAPAAEAPVLQVEHVSKRFRGPDGRERTVVDDVSFALAPGETLGIVGESGSGKSTTARIALALTEPSAGCVLLDGEAWSGLRERRRRERRGRISVVPQDPLGSFDPRWDVGRTIADAIPADVGGSARSEARSRRVSELLEAVGLTAAHARRHPLTLSGGQRQRVAIARSLATSPEILVLDEPVSALDVSIQAQVLDLLGDLQEALGTAHLFISHDLGVVHHVSDRVLVMQAGRVVEQGTADDVFFRPRHDYTRELVAALPHPTLQETA